MWLILFSKKKKAFQQASTPDHKARSTQMWFLLSITLVSMLRFNCLTLFYRRYAFSIKLSMTFTVDLEESGAFA